ncbi:MAG TPA: 50S ribosomal protein L19 [Flavobacteriaceae bacterium]|nr:50S ribosomal protein L19 [Flavobacteriaceae bacterium]
MQPILKYVEDKYIEKNDFPEFNPGDTITAYYKIAEGDKSRTQFFRGVVIQIRGTGATKTFTIRKMSGTVGVERIFPMNLPSLERIEVNKRGSVTRSRIYYFRKLHGKSARIKDRL